MGQSHRYTIAKKVAGSTDHLAWQLAWITVISRTAESIITSGVLGGIRGYTLYTNLRVFLTAYTHLSDHK